MLMDGAGGGYLPTFEAILFSPRENHDCRFRVSSQELGRVSGCTVESSAMTMDAASTEMIKILIEVVRVGGGKSLAQICSRLPSQFSQPRDI